MFWKFRVQNLKKISGHLRRGSNRAKKSRSPKGTSGKPTKCKYQISNSWLNLEMSYAKQKITFSGLKGDAMHPRSIWCPLIYKMFRLNSTSFIPQVEQHKVDSCSMGCLSKTWKGTLLQAFKFFIFKNFEVIFKKFQFKN